MMWGGNTVELMWWEEQRETGKRNSTLWEGASRSTNGWEGTTSNIKWPQRRVTEQFSHIKRTLNPGAPLTNFNDGGGGVGV